jgi:flagellar assembly factor FliW
VTSAAPVTATGPFAFPEGLLGFPEAKRFVLEPWTDEPTPFSLLRSVDVEGLEFLVVPPSTFFPDYVLELDDAAAELIALDDEADALMLVIVTVTEPVASSTANLLGPIVVNLRNGQAVQAVLSSERYRTKEPLFPGAAGERG